MHQPAAPRRRRPRPGRSPPQPVRSLRTSPWRGRRGLLVQPARGGQARTVALEVLPPAPVRRVPQRRRAVVAQKGHGALMTTTPPPRQPPALPRSRAPSTLVRQWSARRAAEFVATPRLVQPRPTVSMDMRRLSAWLIFGSRRMTGRGGAVDARRSTCTALIDATRIVSPCRGHAFFAC